MIKKEEIKRTRMTWNVSKCLDRKRKLIIDELMPENWRSAEVSVFLLKEKKTFATFAHWWYYRAINVLDKNWHNSFTLFIGFENRAWLINAGYLIDSDRNCSFISGVTILGTPTEIYNFGTQYWITIISIFFSGVVVATVYLPVFTTLQLNSVYEVRSV